MGQASTPRLNKTLVSMYWESNFYQKDFVWLSFKLHFFFNYFFFNFYTKFNIVSLHLWNHLFFFKYFSELAVENSFNVLRKKSYLLNSRRYDKAYRRSVEWMHRLYTPGTSYIYGYVSNYFLISLYLKGNIEEYKIDSEGLGVSFNSGGWIRDKPELMYLRDNWC